MEISIIIVNYENYHLTEKCINSVINNTKKLDYEVIVLDNASSNNSYEYLNDKFQEYSNIKLIKNESNQGYGAGNNLAIRYCNSDVILFLNPDVIVIDDAIEKMYAKLKQHEDIGLIGCKLLNDDSTLQYSCRRIMPFKEFIIARTPLKRLFSKKYVEKINYKYLMKDIDHSKEANVDWVMGSSMMIRKDLFKLIEGFSKEYFMYFEDVDLCYKVRIVGKKVLYYPKAEMYHLHKQESVKKINKLTFIHLSSTFKFYKKFILNSWESI